MCVPCGPRWRGTPGRSAFCTLDAYCLHHNEEKVLEKYPDPEAALDEIRAYITAHIDHTEKWIINELVLKNELLASIWARQENRDPMHKFYLAEKRKKAA